jgi:predicted regulator of Ras-like GTPase activity (Roadblock/LC7/MglB family)
MTGKEAGSKRGPSSRNEIMNDTERLREERLVFYREEIASIDAILKELVKLSGATCALLIDKDGHLVSRTGTMKDFDLDTIAALVAGSFAATREMARVLGEDEFTVLFHQGPKGSIQLSLVGERTILAVIFNDRTTVGMVRLYTLEASNKLAELFQSLQGRRQASAGAGVELAADYTESAKDRLESLFPRS